MRKLVIIAGNDEGREFELARGKTVLLGRDAKCDIHIEDDRISRRHAAVEFREGRPVLVDQKSSNGTFVNGALIRQHVLGHGDKVTLGAVTLRYVSDVDPHSEAPAAAGAERSTIITTGPLGAEARTAVIGPPHGTSEMCDAMQVVATAVDSAMPAAAAAGVALHMSLDRNAPVPMDANGLYQAVVALLVGALRCVPAGEDVTVTIQRAADEMFLELAARRRAGACAEDELAAACEAGALAQAKQLMMAHGGSMVLGYEGDNGRLFALWIPTQKTAVRNKGETQ